MLFKLLFDQQFYKDIGSIVICLNIMQVNLSGQNTSADELVLPFNMLHFGMKHKIFCKLDAALVVAANVEVKMRRSSSISQIGVDSSILTDQWDHKIWKKPEFEDQPMDVNNVFSCFRKCFVFGFYSRIRHRALLFIGPANWS